MSRERSEAEVLWRFKRYVISLLWSLKKNREAILHSYNNDSLHDFRVAVRKLLSLDKLFEKTVGICLDERLREKLRSALRISSRLRDLEELFAFVKGAADVVEDRRHQYLSELRVSLSDGALEREVLHGYLALYRLLKEQNSKIFHIRDAALEVVIEDMFKSSKRYAKAVKDEGVDFDRLHTVRKRCKRIRYQLDFLFFGENEGSLICKRIQDKLGKVNDLRVWLSMLKDDLNLGQRIENMLSKALKEAKAEAEIFASKEYCGFIATELRRRMAIC